MPHSTLVSPEELARHLDDPSWVVVDCRHDLANPEAGERDYRKAHVPGARFMHADRDLSGAPNGRNGRHPLPDASTFMTRLGAAGIDRTKQVVVYDAQGGGICVRLWWMLKHWLGHDAVAVLDGGWAKWLKDDHPESSVVPTPAATRFEATPRNVTVGTDFVAMHLGDPWYVVLDARSGERYRGESETIDPAAGHIPGAVNRFFKENLRPDGTFKSAEALRTEYAALLGNAVAERVIHQCGSGVSACHNVLAMELAGLPGGRLYVGSWSEWCADPSRPRATGAAP
jgi:thiosulfate/3-mercaptopyruvate sulfurtransferase